MEDISLSDTLWIVHFLGVQCGCYVSGERGSGSREVPTQTRHPRSITVIDRGPASSLQYEAERGWLLRVYPRQAHRDAADEAVR